MNKPRIVVVGDWERALPRLSNWSAIEALADVVFHAQKLEGRALIDAITPADVLVLVRDRTPFGEAELSQLPHLKLLIFTGTRNTTLDLAALHRRHIPVCHTEWGPSKDSTCELTWTLILAASKQLQQRQTDLLEGRWRPDAPAQLPGVLAGKTLGLIGLGEIGGRVARVGQALGMQVQTWSPRMTHERAAEKGARFVPLETLLGTSDVVSLHLVPTEATKHLLNAQTLALMKPNSLLVNTSRSALIDMSALVQALHQNRVGGAALDVFDIEPLPQDDPIRQAPRVLLTPHMGFVAEEVYAQFAKGVTECLTAWLHAQPLPRQIAPQ